MCNGLIVSLTLLESGGELAIDAKDFCSTLLVHLTPMPETLVHLSCDPEWSEVYGGECNEVVGAVWVNLRR